MKKIFSAILMLVTLFIISGKAYAFCPVCTVAVGAGLGLARWLGIDDTITGLWIGGLLISLIMWTINYLAKKKWTFKGYKIVIFVAYYAIVVLPLYFTGMIGHADHKFGGIDKLVLGIVVGSILFYLGGLWYYYLKKKNKGHANFPFQKVVMPVAPLIVMSIIFYFLTK